MKQIMIALFFLVSLSSVAHLQAQNQSAQMRAAEAIQQLGGKVQYDSTNTSVIKVDLNNTKINDSDLRHLREFRNLQWLDLRITEIGDEGVGHLKRLEQLTFLNLFRTKLTDNGLSKFKKTDEA